MSPDRLQQDLDYVVAAVRRHDTSLGVPAIYFLWAVLVPVGFALPDLAPGIAGPYWCTHWPACTWNARCCGAAW